MKPLSPELQALVDGFKSGTHQWTAAEKEVYWKIVASMTPEKAVQFKALIPPPSN